MYRARRLLHQGDRTPRVAGVAVEMFRQAAARHPFHGEAVLALEMAHAVDRHDIRVLELRRCTRLDVKALHLPPFRQHPRTDPLESDDAVENLIAGTEDDSHV